MPDMIKSGRRVVLSLTLRELAFIQSTFPGEQGRRSSRLDLLSATAVQTKTRAAQPSCRFM